MIIIENNRIVIFYALHFKQLYFTVDILLENSLIHLHLYRHV